MSFFFIDRNEIFLISPREENLECSDTGSPQEQGKVPELKTPQETNKANGAPSPKTEKANGATSPKSTKAKGELPPITEKENLNNKINDLVNVYNATNSSKARGTSSLNKAIIGKYCDLLFYNCVNFNEYWL